MNLKKEERRLEATKASGEALLARSAQGCKADSKPGRKQKGQNHKKKGVCSWCKQPGHWWRECPTRPKDQIPNSVKTNDSKKESKFRGKVKALCANLEDDDDQSWFFDSGASYHMTGC